jgi:Tol biopolymer transport system component
MKRILIGTLAVILSAFAGFTQNVSDLFYQAVHLQEVKGDLEAAIPLFEKVVAGSKDAPLAAKAQLRIAMCYEKLGREEAYQAYEKVIREYARQIDTVNLAKEKLSELKKARSVATEAAKEPKLTKIYTGKDYASSISPDGKQLAVIRSELSSRDIWIRKLVNGTETRLTNLMILSSDPVWSPDSRWIAFADRDRDIKIVSVPGGALKTLFTTDSNAKNTGGIALTGWTSDSKKLVFQIPSRGLFAAAVAGGEPEPVCIFDNPDEARRHEAMTLSPDGRWIAYSAAQNGNTDIFVMSTTGRIPIRVTTNPAADRNPRWSPDGNWLGFASYGTENPQIWVIKISPKGLPDGLPLQIPEDAHILGGNWTGTASIGFAAAFRTDHIFTANTDGTGETQLTQFSSVNARPIWSPNGERIAFRSDYRKPLNRYQLWTVASTGGAPGLVSDKEVGSFIWSPDGERLLFVAGAGLNRSVIMEASARGGEPKEVMTIDGDIDGLSRSPDGRTIFFAFTIEPARFANAEEYLKERLSGIGAIPIDGGESRIIIPADKKGIWYSDCRPDPEGKRLAYIMFDYAQYNKEGMYSIWTMDLDGGPPRQITRGGEYALCWSPDGKWIIYEKRIKDMDFELYKVPADGGEPVKMNIRGQRPEFSPDGNRIVFSRTLGWGYEYWLAENFLPGQAGREK